MRITGMVLLVVLLSFEIQSQSIVPFKLSNNKNSSPNYFLKYKSSLQYNGNVDTGNNVNRSLEHFPFQFGVEGCFSTWGAKNTSVFGGLGYVNINIWNKTVLLKFEYGMLISSGSYLLHFISLSGQYKFADIKNLHKFYGGLGICASAGEGAGGGSYFVNFKYLYASTENLGITGGFRLFTSGNGIKNFWNGFMFEAGIQIFH